MELRILGPFEVHDASGREVRLPAGRERALLAVLALHLGEVVSVDALVDALWGERPPSTAAKAVQGYVSHLRRLLEPAGPNGMLQTRPPGYALRADEVDVDARRFEALAAQGWRELERDPAAALGTFEGALALWRGPVLGEFAFAEFAQQAIHRLEELRLETVEGRCEAQLALGRHGAIVAELVTRVEEHPLRERLRGQLMLALYRCGRQAEALQVYRDGRRLLADELALEPGIELQRLERAILAHDPSLDLPGARDAQPARAEARRPWRRALRLVGAGASLLVAAVGSLVLGYELVRDDGHASVAGAPPALTIVDPATNRVVGSVRVGSRPVTVAAGGGYVWVGDSRDGTVTQVDPRTRQVVKTIGIGSPVVDLAFGLGSVWAATGGFGEVVRIDPELGTVGDRFSLGDPDDPVEPSISAIGAGGGRVWASAPDGLARIDPSSGEVLDTVDLGRSSALQIAVGGGAVWATTLASRAKRIEASSGRETAEFYAGSPVFPIAIGGRAVWIGGANGQVWKVDPSTGTAMVTSRPTAGVAGIAYGEDAVWVTGFVAPGPGGRDREPEPPRSELVRLDPESGGVVERIAIGAPALDVTVDRGLVWVPVVRPPQ